MLCGQSVETRWPSRQRHFEEWVIEDSFAGARPDWPDVQFVADPKTPLPVCSHFARGACTRCHKRSPSMDQFLCFRNRQRTGPSAPRFNAPIPLRWVNRAVTSASVSSKSAISSSMEGKAMSARFQKALNCMVSTCDNPRQFARHNRIERKGRRVIHDEQHRGMKHSAEGAHHNQHADKAQKDRAPTPRARPRRGHQQQCATEHLPQVIRLEPVYCYAAPPDNPDRDHKVAGIAHERQLERRECPQPQAILPPYPRRKRTATRQASSRCRGGADRRLTER
ncbi:hypothetical protein GQR58_030312 [Nymphon striatum]|nr:hypothetical protein GQR58_030312 [Nymphon striatum]